jgi:hypothetical protein
MRLLAKILVLTSAAAGVAVLGVVGPAQASTVKCAERPLRVEAPDIVIVTCAEAEGDQRRSLSTVINSTAEAIQLMDLRALISHPEYGLTDCGASRLEPGARAECVSPWVTVGRFSGNHVAAYSLVRVIEAQGRYTSVVGIIHTTF